MERLEPIILGSNILILGAGIIGIMWSIVLHLSGHRNVIICEDRESRKKVIKDLGELTKHIFKKFVFIAKPLLTFQT